MKLKQINITFLVETDDILATLHDIDQEVQETWPLGEEAEAHLAYINGFGDTYNISYHIKIEDKNEPADNTESEAEASDYYPEILGTLPPE